MISIITAVHNQIAVNKIFLESLQRYTKLPHEIIIIDNASTDGSRELFEAAGAKIIRNDGNYSYPYCQNQGIRAARYDIFAFLNNDIVVAPSWDERIVKTMELNGLELATSCGVERLENAATQKAIRKKWSFIKRLVGLFGKSERNLRLMHRLMYGDWERFTEKRFEKFQYTIREGFVGNTVLMKRSALDKIGYWDERIYGADYDLYIRSKIRSQEVGDIKPLHTALGVFNHHFIRVTLHAERLPFKDQANIISCEEKWGDEAMRAYINSLNPE